MWVKMNIYRVRQKFPDFPGLDSCKEEGPDEQCRFTCA